MELLAIILGLIAATAGIVILIVFIGKFRTLNENLKTLQDAGKNNESFVLLNQNLQGMQSRLDQNLQGMQATLGETTKTLHQTLQRQFGDSTKIIQDVTERLTKLDETNRQVVGFSEQLQNLQDILKNPKQRGVLGEYYLETLLKNVLPPGVFQMQYAFKDGEIVDAIVRVKDKIVPIDSKFSLENYNRIIEADSQTEKARLEKVFVNDLKFRIQETAKYIRPDEGTMEFAFMFIPHEAIYYDLLINKIGAVHEDTENLIQRAAGKYHVIIVSPTSFLAYLQTVLQGLKAMQIEEDAKVILERVIQLNKHILAYDDLFKRLGRNLDTTVNAYNLASKELSKVDKDVVKLTGTQQQILPETVDRPQLEG